MTNTMKSLKITGKLAMAITEDSVPEPQANQVRIKVAYVGVCGSDLHYYYEGANGAFVVKEPLIPGHELSGTVDIDPSGELQPGTRITIHPARFGNELPEISDRPHLWPQGSYLGSASTNPHTQGAMCDYMIVERSMIRLLPDAISLKGAALAEPLAVGLHAINIAGGVKGKEVLVSGSGPIGLLAAAAAKLLGATSVTASDVLDGPLNRAKQVGATDTVKVTETPLPTEAFDVVLECSGVPRAISAALNAVRRAGVVVQVGMLAAGDQPIALASLVSKEIQLRGTFRFNNEIDDAIALLAQHPSLEHVITHTFSIDEAIAGFEMAKNSELSGKVLIEL
jgi:L-idonate 5-dehydrogenase